MHALFVGIKNICVALAAGGGNRSAGLQFRFLNIMRAVAVGANCGIQVSACSGFGVHAILGFLEIGGMAFLTGQVIRS